MQVYVIYEGQKREFVGEATNIEDVLKALGINTESIIARRGDIVLPVEDKVNDGDEIELIRIFSGG